MRTSQPDQPSAGEVRARRQQARARAATAAEPVRAEVRRTHGLTLPDHAFTFLAFWWGLSDTEHTAMDRSVELHLGGVLDRFALDPQRPTQPKENLDHRLYFRYYNDPPEFLTVLTGDTDGLHWGLWYDHPDQPPPFIAGYYSNDGDDITRQGTTLLETVRLQVEQAQAHHDWNDFGEHPEATQANQLALQLLRSAVYAYETADRPEEGEDYVDAYSTRQLAAGRVPTVSGIGVHTDDSSSRLRDLIATCSSITAGTLGDLLRNAQTHLEDGDPVEALALGHDLHWLSAGDPEREHLAHQLLTNAYHALGRHALADIADVHHRHRNLPSRRSPEKDQDHD